MPKYSENVLEQIKSRLSISEVVSSYVKLTKKGDRHWGLCPFHHEKTPSFTVLDSGGFYKCFGCQKGGGMFDFIMEIEHVDFATAVEILAKKANVELKEETDAEKKAYSKQKSLEILYDKIAVSFHQYLLKRPDAQYAREYISKRNISPQTLEKFNIGYATDNPNWLYSFLQKNGYSVEMLAESGLFSKDKAGFPFFKNRILFPVKDWHGHTVAFSGRTLLKDDKVAKYKNSSDTLIYNKKNNLFGFYESIPKLRQNDTLILCEGNFDVISLHQAGFDYAAAPLGTAFTDEQARLIKRYCNKVILLFDSDNAGQNATIKGLIKCQQNNIENFVVKLEGAKDASEMLETKGPEGLKKALTNPVPGFCYLVSLALKMYDIRQPKGKLSVFKEVRPYLDATESPIERRDYIKYLSERINIPEEQIVHEYNHQSVQTKDPGIENQSPAKKQKFNPLSISPELNCMLLLINNRSCFEYFRSKIKIKDLDDKDACKLYMVLEDASRQEFKTDDVILQMITDEDLKELVVTSFTMQMHKPSDVKKAVDEAIRTVKLTGLENKRQSLQKIIKTSEMENLSKEDFISLLEAKSALDKEIEDLSKEL